jgi:hypothetical protein
MVDEPGGWEQLHCGIGRLHLCDIEGQPVGTLWDIGEAMLPEPRRELGQSGPQVRIRVRVISNVERPVWRSPPASDRLKFLLVLCSKSHQPLAPCNGG